MMRRREGDGGAVDVEDGGAIDVVEGEGVIDGGGVI